MMGDGSLMVDMKACLEFIILLWKIPGASVL